MSPGELMIFSLVMSAVFVLAALGIADAERDSGAAPPRWSNKRSEVGHGN